LPGGLDHHPALLIIQMLKVWIGKQITQAVHILQQKPNVIKAGVGAHIKKICVSESSESKRKPQTGNHNFLTSAIIAPTDLHLPTSCFCRVLPPLYHGSLPNGYTKVVNQWQQDNTKTDPTEFEWAYNKFLKGK